MKQLVLILISLIFIGCGDGEDRVSSTGEEVSNANMIVQLEIGETRTFALNLDLGESYLVTAESVNNNNIVSYQIDYLNRSFPEIVVNGVNDGTESFVVTAQDASGYKQTALVRATVYEGTTDLNGSAIDEAGTVGGGSSTDPGGGTDDPGTTPPIVDPVYDPNACLENSSSWSYVDDSWGTPEGQFSTDLNYWVRSMIPTEPSVVRFYYKKFNVTANGEYYSAGTYSYNTGDYTVKFAVQMLQSLVGLSSNTVFYVKVRDTCYKGYLPTSIFMPADTGLTPVFSTAS